MKIFLAADHAGFRLKGSIKRFLEKKGKKAVDLGTHSEQAVDYPDYALKAARKVRQTHTSFGILVCGSGIGMSITANKVKGIRAALCRSVKTAKLAREHNNANVLCLGARLTKQKIALRIVQTFLNTKFSRQARHKRRVKKMDKL